MNTEHMSPRDIQDFQNEIELMSKLRPHNNVVQVGMFCSISNIQLYGYCLHPLQIVTEYLENGSLWDYLMGPNKLSMPAKRKIIVGIARGMLHLHLEKIIHRGNH